MWYIAWASQLTGAEGRGSYVFDSREEAKKHCQELNVKYPKLLHWVVEVQAQPA